MDDTTTPTTTAPAAPLTLIADESHLPMDPVRAHLAPAPGGFLLEIKITERTVVRQVATGDQIMEDHKGRMFRALLTDFHTEGAKQKLVESEAFVVTDTEGRKRAFADMVHKLAQVILTAPSIQ